MTRDALSHNPLAAAACGHDDPAVHKLLISAFQHMLLTRSYLTAEDAADDAVAPRPGHELAVATGRPVEVVNVLTDATEAVANRDVAALATLVGGDAQELEAIYGMLDLFLLISRDEWQEATEHINHQPSPY